MKQGLEDVASVLREFPGGQTISALTIVGGSVTPTRGTHSIDTEAAAASDDLANIVVTNTPDGRLLFISSVSAARDVVVKHLAGGSGQISLATGKDFTLGDPSMTLVLRLNGTTWSEVMRYRGTLGGWHVQTQAGAHTVAETDNQSVIRCTAALTQNVTACATLGDGVAWAVYANGGAVTIDPNGAETINGLSTLVLADGDFAFVYCNGATLYAFVVRNGKAASVASAATTSIWDKGGELIHVTGATGPITSFGTALYAGQRMRVIFDGAPIVNHVNGAIEFSGGAPVPMAAGDVIEVVADTAAKAIVTLVRHTATQADQEAGTHPEAIVTPKRQHSHPSAAKAWVKFNGTGTVTINASYNVSSITDNGVGDYTVNFTISFSSAEYAVSTTCRRATTDENLHFEIEQATAPTAGACRMQSLLASTGTAEDALTATAIFFGDQ